MTMETAETQIYMPNTPHKEVEYALIPKTFNCGGQQWIVNFVDRLGGNHLGECRDYGVRQLEKIACKGYRIDLNQGNSARLVDDAVAKLFARIRWIGSIIRFAADTPRQIAEVETAMAKIDAYRIEQGNPLHHILSTR